LGLGMHQLPALNKNFSSNPKSHPPHKEISHPYLRLLVTPTCSIVPNPFRHLERAFSSNHEFVLPSRRESLFLYWKLDRIFWVENYRLLVLVFSSLISGVGLFYLSSNLLMELLHYL